MSTVEHGISTTAVLLGALRDERDATVWIEFDARFRPVLARFAQHLGLDAADAADVAQETLVRFVQEYRAGRYDRDRGKLRQWLIAIARCRAADVRRRSARQRVVRGASAFEDLLDDESASRIWDVEQRRFLLETALRELRESTRFSERTLVAFERVALRDEPVEAVAAELGVPVKEIYDAKSRVVQRLRELMKRYQEVR
jgi:RNA polymerase sigma-70 factor (ECF subfamily)